MRYFLAVLLGLLSLLGLVSGAFATEPASSLDVTAATTLISGDVTTAVRNIGLALIALAAIVLGLKWVKASFFVLALGVMVAFGMSPETAFATSLDVSAATTLIAGDVTTAIRNIGLALIALAAIVLGLKWVKASFF